MKFEVMDSNPGGSLRIDWFDGSVSEQPPIEPAPALSHDAEASAGRDRPERKLMGFRRLAELAESDAGAVVLVLSGRTSFWDLLETDLKPDFIVLVAKVLVRLCEGSPSLARPLLLRALHSRYIATLTDYMLSLPSTRITEKRFNAQFWCDVEGFMTCVLRVCSAAYRLAGERRRAATLLLAARATVAGLADEHREICSEEVHQLMDRLEAELEADEGSVSEKVSASPSVTRLEPVRGEFRSMSVLPTRADLLEPGRGAELERNRLRGAYRNLEHYLDVQFRLLREDYIAPLRKGIRNYLQDPTKSEYESLRVYRGVRLLRPHVSSGHVGYLVSLPPATRAHNHLMFGSLLLFTGDDFATLFCATVLDSSAALLRTGLLAVSLHGPAPADARRRDLLMLESEVYLEPYRHVLAALKEVMTLPMSDYIVHVKTQIKPPAYLTPETKYIMPEAGNESIVSVLDDKTWPGPEELGLDESQYEAYKLALTNELGLIQGPPGTGKTYIGLRIVKTLLGNLSLAGTPLLVICYTNHALDQFLEQILEITTDVVRLGGQSKSERLEPYTLNNLRSRSRSKHAYVYNMKVKQLEDIVKRMIEIQGIIDGCEKVLIPYNLVKPFLKIGNKQYDLDSRRGKQDPVGEWLFSHLQGEMFLTDSADGEHSDVRTNQRDTEEESETILENWDDVANVLKALPNLESCFSESWVQREIECMQLSRTHVTESECQVEQCLEKFSGRINELNRKLECFKSYLRRDRNQLDQLSPRRPVKSLHELLPDARWALYFRAADEVREQFLADMTQLEREHETRSAALEQLGSLLDAEAAAAARVLGATTTSAARRRTLLAALRSPVVLVEEAAEVLEAHIVAALSPHCQHLILIGDHQQLRPSTADYELSRSHALGVSLPERLLSNAVHGRRLETQRRMRPLLLSLVCPHVYPALRSHADVASAPRVRGLRSDLFFCTHDRGEEECGDASRSYSSAWEARWAVALAAHLRRQDYAPAEIVLLTAYAAQARLIAQMSKDNPLLAGVRIAVVDNYQGEESRIVVLSLVRSNKDGDVGFLASDNRVCVALTRAREGLYMFGDMSCLRRHSFWLRVEEVLLKEGAIGESLELCCRNHPENITQVSSPEQIAERCPGGGCGATCGQRLACGHNCAARCHGYDTEHRVFTCGRPCEMTCSYGHACPLTCGEPCGACSVRAEVALPCGHAAQLPCFARLQPPPCGVSVTATLPACLHQVVKPCHQELRKVRCDVCSG